MVCNGENLEDKSFLKHIAPSFHKVDEYIRKNKYTHYWLKGGRGSSKSSFISLEIIRGIMKDKNANAVAIRKIGVHLKDTVFEQLLWAIETLDVEDLWKAKVSPLELMYLPTQQKIIFKGGDRPRKMKSIKFKHGYCKFIWFEEADEFKGMDEIRNINQSLMRGGDKFLIFYSYNPPNSTNNWINKITTEFLLDSFIHSGSYLDVPKEWIGTAFIVEANFLKKTNPKKYENDYLGKPVGTGREVFTNVTIREITEEEKMLFDNILEGIDWGYATDPFVWIKLYYDTKRKKLYIYDEIFEVGLSNRLATEKIKEKKHEGIIIADSAEPKSIAELREYGLKIYPAKKGAGSISYGMKFLRGEVSEIIIDKKNCRNCINEFLNYEFEKDLYGNFKALYPDKNNHTIDAVRYALEQCMFEKKLRGNIFVLDI